jgi:hypothetical protein
MSDNNVYEIDHSEHSNDDDDEDSGPPAIGADLTPSKGASLTPSGSLAIV